ncbi:MAG: TonB-dependent receptor plug domain-containing protein [bacterium]
MKLRLLFVFLIAFQWISSQNITLRSAADEYPIPGVAVYNDDKTTTAVSDLDGIVDISEFENEEFIFFTHISFKTKKLRKKSIGKVVYLSPDQKSLEEVVISASKFEQSKREVAQKIISISSEDIVFSNPQTAADILNNTGSVFIQKSQLGGGSPIIRGFSTNRLMLAVDGVRMNTAIFRGGNVQNVISIDPFSVSKTEVILGAGSVIYGSDAVGGVMNFITKAPRFSQSDSLYVDVMAVTRYASASNEKTGHLDFNLGKKNFASLTSISFTDFDDLRMGKNGPDDYLRNEYVTRQDGQDVVVTNEDPLIQRFTGYNQLNLMQKFSYKPSTRLTYDLGLHYSETSDYPRYDRLIRRQEGQLRSAQWDYGPQGWFMSNFRLSKFSSSSNLYDNLKLTLAYQNFKESRLDRDFGSEIRQVREEEVDVFSVNLDIEKTLSSTSKITYGLEYLNDKVGSEAYQENIDNNQREAISTRYPDGSTWQSFAGYFNYKYRPNISLTIQSGLRYNFISIKSDLTANNVFFNFPFNEANLDTGALTGGFGLSWTPNDKITWKLNATTAFRAPNVDDVGKIFDSEAGSVVVPNPDLEAEYAYSGEIGFALNINDAITLDLSTYYTYLKDALIRAPYTINGESEIIYDGELSEVLAIQNAAKAYIYGFEAGLNWRINKQLNFKSQYTYVGGTQEDENGLESPVRHVAPAFGNVHLLWNSNRLKLDGFIQFNQELSFEDLAPSQVANDFLYAKDENGNPYAPSWHTLNLRSEYELSPNLSLSLTLENITDQRYRPYSSGLAGAGRNLIAAVRYNL